MNTPTHYKDIHGWFDYESLYFTIFSGLKDQAHIVEVGSWLGRSACYMAELIKVSGKNIRLDCIDNWSEPQAEKLKSVIKGNDRTHIHDFVNNLHHADVLEFVHVVQLPSLEAVHVYADKSLDFVFLDNDHSEEHVLSELNAWWPRIKKGGVLAGHDYIESRWPGVVKAVTRFGKTHRKKFIVDKHSFVFRK